MTKEFRRYCKIEANEGGWITHPIFTNSGTLALTQDENKAIIFDTEGGAGHHFIKNANACFLIIHPLPEDQLMRLNNAKELPL